MPIPEGLVVPQLTPETVSVFLAEDREHKREAVIASLEDFDFTRNLVTATNYVDAKDFIEGQKPGDLTTNVYLLDGSLDPDHDATWQGNHLAGALFQRYYGPFSDIETRTLDELIAAGLTRKLAIDVVDGRILHSFAAKKMMSEALVAGISISDDGALSEDFAQFPRTDYRNVGRLIYETVIPSKIRKHIENQKARAEHEARSSTHSSQAE